MLGIFNEIESEKLCKPGVVLRRKSAFKDQQGLFIKHGDESKTWILAEVIDLKNGQYVAEGGIIKYENGDKIYISDQTFLNPASDSDKAWEILTSWALYNQNQELQSQIRNFVSTSFLPDQILDWKKKDTLKNLFVPIQEKFKIGKHIEKVDPVKIRVELFRDHLKSLSDGKHMTYVAFIPRNTNSQPMFFSIGTKPHLETKTVLERQIYGFHPNHGGHIKCSVDAQGQSTLLVDGGSNDLGAGIHTSLATAEMLADGLKILYPEFNYQPLPGRGAFGIQQSY